jgi:hypothetical protein
MTASRMSLTFFNLLTDGRRSLFLKLGKNPNEAEEEATGSYIERYGRKGLSPCFYEIKMNRRAFVSINRMRAGYFSLKEV